MNDSVGFPTTAVLKICPCRLLDHVTSLFIRSVGLAAIRAFVGCGLTRVITPHLPISSSSSGRSIICSAVQYAASQSQQQSFMETFRVRLNCIDYYHALPTSFDPDVPTNFDSKQTDFKPRVPVLRVFGATETGQKVCAHIHGAFPYLYVRYDGSLTPDDG